MMATSAGERTVDRGSLGPVGRSATERGLRYLTTVLGKIP
jgi:hypothetical protein